jgi:signal transduction histidine kinase
LTRSNGQDEPSRGRSAEVPSSTEPRRIGHGDEGPEMHPVSEPDQADLRAILANLGREICQPLEALRGRIEALLGARSGPISDAERGQAETMLRLCDDLGRLTRDCLGGPGSGEG